MAPARPGLLRARPRRAQPAVPRGVLAAAAAADGADARADAQDAAGRGAVAVRGGNAGVPRAQLADHRVVRLGTDRADGAGVRRVAAVGATGRAADGGACGA